MNPASTACAAASATKGLTAIALIVQHRSHCRRVIVGSSIKAARQLTAAPISAISNLATDGVPFTARAYRCYGESGKRGLERRQGSSMHDGSSSDTRAALGVFRRGWFPCRSRPQRFATAAAAPGAIVRGRLVAADTNLPFRDATVSLQPLSSQPPQPGREKMEWMTAGRLRPSTPRGDSSSPTCGPDRIGLSQLPCRRPCDTSRASIQRLCTDGPRSFRVSAGQAPAEIVDSSSSRCRNQRTRRGRTRSAAIVCVGQRSGIARGGRTRAPAGFAASLGARTDDNGSFRLFGLQAGEYIVVAQPPPVPTGAARGLPRSAAYNPPTYYPAALSAADAGRLRLRAGEEHRAD